MKMRLVGLGALMFAIAGGATALALVQSSENAAPVVSADTGRTSVGHRADEGDDNEDVIALADLPAAVRTALAGITADSAVTQVSREAKKDGSTTYDVE